MRIVVVGGGSGGHVTPTIAVVNEIWKIKPRADIEFWTDRKYYKNVVKITIPMGMRIKTRKTISGKLRRYVKRGWRFYVVEHPDIIPRNIIGVCAAGVGFFQSFGRLIVRRPDAIFIKGGYVGLPVGVAAWILRVPYVIHDSDTTPGLANRILARWAKKIGTGMPLEYYNYPEAKARWVGTPVGEEFAVVGKTREKTLKKMFGYDTERPLVMITGGSLGARHINEAVREILPELTKMANVGLVAGRARYEEMADLKKYETWEDGKFKGNFRMWEFNSAMWEFLGAADVVVSRAGATTIAELAALKKAVILVPNAMLPGSHQVKNAEMLADAGAAVVVKDEDIVEQPGVLLKAVERLVRRKAEREKLAEKMHELAKSEAARELAEMVVECGGK